MQILCFVHIAHIMHVISLTLILRYLDYATYALHAHYADYAPDAECVIYEYCKHHAGGICYIFIVVILST